MPDTALLVVDLQSALLVGAHDAEGCLVRVAALAGRARAAGAPVVYLRQRVDHPDVPADLLEVHPAVAPHPGDTVLEKDSADSFLGTSLDELLRGRGVRRVVLTGYATEYCVDSTGRSALSHGYDLVLAADGHTTPTRPADSPLPAAAQVVVHHNALFATILYAGRTVRVLPAAEIDFTTR
ncbi:Nicotinamidase-related amidase [Streptomyces sp. TLI_053]|uniref:isochorismatase family protein n=1 Tax=Streptomyces sp. TLI_053 TaxID=1855352 RepID=UPI0008798A67|nr:isochorismatase family protein [Streptomyces sp. TLI_053]SDS79184.1 Nicotinamidase-related amidase [Streptomyces sp. TLI_053]